MVEKNIISVKKYIVDSYTALQADLLPLGVELEDLNESDIPEYLGYFEWFFGDVDSIEDCEVAVKNLAYAKSYNFPPNEERQIINLIISYVLNIKQII
jgi:hypothetical protein